MGSCRSRPFYPSFYLLGLRLASLDDFMQTITTKKEFVTTDGRQFSDKAKAKAHEKHCEIVKHIKERTGAGIETEKLLPLVVLMCQCYKLTKIK